MPAFEFESGDSHWRAALRLYDRDALEEAWRLVADHGLDDQAEMLREYRILEAEWETRKRSRVEGLTDWLEWEYVPGAVLSLREGTADRIRRAAEGIGERLGWDHRERVRVTLLAPETDVPWAMHPYGYCARKEPYAKLCLPDYLLEDPLELEQAVAHEYAHVISEELSGGQAPMWLEEVVSVLAERHFDPEAWDAFVEDPGQWLGPSDLEVSFTDPGEDEEEAEWDVWLAYQQAGWIGLYLASLGSERKLGDLLRWLGDPPGIQRLLGRLRGDLTEPAFRAVYGMGVGEAFDRAYAFLAESGRPAGD